MRKSVRMGLRQIEEDVEERKASALLLPQILQAASENLQRQL